jgi:hypothetical protein
MMVDLRALALRWGCEGANEAPPIYLRSRHRHGRVSGAASSDGAGLSQPCRHARRQLPARRLDRCHGAHPARAAEPGARAEYRHRQPRGCWRDDRGRSGRQCQVRRLHASPLGQLGVDHQQISAKKLSVRSEDGVCPHHADVGRRARARCSSVVAGARRDGAHCIRENE